MEAIQEIRETALVRYRRMRKIASHHATEALRRVTKGMLQHWAKRIGLLTKEKV